MRSAPVWRLALHREIRCARPPALAMASARSRPRSWAPRRLCRGESPWTAFSPSDPRKASMRRWFSNSRRDPSPDGVQAARTRPVSGEVMRVPTLVVVYNPIVEAEGGRRLTDVLGWYDPTQLIAL